MTKCDVSFAQHMDLGITIKRSKVVWRQVADQVRRRILTKQLTPGTKLPSTAEMAAQIGTDVPTLHRALTELVNEGLITRTPRIGTHVANWEKGLLRLGVYHSGSVLAQADAASPRVLEAEIHRAAAQLKISVQVWTDTRPLAKQGSALPVIEHAARERIIQGLISTDWDEMHAKWFHKLPVPVTSIASNAPAMIRFDEDNFFAVALQTLAKQGCRSLAFLGPRKSGGGETTRFYAACDRAGLTRRLEWQKTPDRIQAENITDEAFGYQAFRRLWAGGSRPDGLIVYPDSVTSGVVMAILEEKVRVPQDLKVVLHRHAEVNLFCPFEATFVTSRLADGARALINKVDTYLKGRELKRVLLQHEVVANPMARN